MPSRLQCQFSPFLRNHDSQWVFWALNTEKLKNEVVSCRKRREESLTLTVVYLIPFCLVYLLCEAANFIARQINLYHAHIDSVLQEQLLDTSLVSGKTLPLLQLCVQVGSDTSLLTSQDVKNAIETFHIVC
eukprot:g62141.t1